MGRALVGFGDVRLSNAEGRRLALHLQIGRLLYAIGPRLLFPLFGRVFHSSTAGTYHSTLLAKLR